MKHYILLKGTNQLENKHSKPVCIYILNTYAFNNKAHKNNEAKTERAHYQTTTKRNLTAINPFFLKCTGTIHQDTQNPGL